MAGERLHARFTPIASFGFGGQEISSNPPHPIHKPLWSILQSH